MKIATNTGFAELLSPWGKATALVFSTIVGLLAIYHETFFSMVYIWVRSETFAHCFLIFPISGYLVFLRGPILANLVPAADYRPLLLIAAVGFAWLMADLADVAAAQQFALVAMIPVAVWIVLGRKVVSELAFPLAFLLFSVPFGEFLMPRMMDFTADFTIATLRATGMPVYREGNHFSIPSGDWSVVEACSGLRYLIASLTLGCLFAYFNFRSLWRRTVFIAFSIIVPIIANGFRAYMIVMIAHLSGMKLALGVDHFIYGWVFFGLVMALLFWLGSKWSDEPAQREIPAQAPAPPCALAATPWQQGRMAAAAAAVLAVSLLWPARAGYVDGLVARQAASVVALAEPEPRPPWRQASAMTAWRPRYFGASARQRHFYTDGKHVVGLMFEYYRGQEQGREVINSGNVLVTADDKHWKSLGETLAPIRLAGSEFKVLQDNLQSFGQRLLVWRWNWIIGEHTVNNYLLKLYEARSKLLGGGTDAAAVIVATEVGDDLPGARLALQRFVDDMLPPINKSLEDAAVSGGREP